MKKLILLVLALAVCGCSAHSAWITEDTTDAIPIANSTYPAHSSKVFITEALIPDGAHFEPIAKIDVGKIWYGSADNVLDSMAIRARELGADAVIEVKTWRQPSGFSWAAPHGSGLAIKLVNPKGFDFSKLNGEWR